mmetsp:Transcript_15728/g.33621  ORF Transcript_15728/g.33621 Transcript_15728/m.33621 type:complete len:430 (-) Transcript_15728:757-2046(-)
MAAACLGACAASCACAACCKGIECLGCSCLLPPKLANAVYCVFIVAATVTALLFRYYEVDMHVCVGDIDDCSDTSWTDESSYSYELCEGDTCTGIWSVFRISFTCAVFFALLLLSNLHPSQCAAYTHRGYWFAKIVFVAFTAASTILMPNDVFAYYAWVARFLAPGFLIYQLVFFIDFGYRANTALVSYDEDPTRRRFLCSDNESGVWFKRAVLLTCVVLYACCFAGWVLMYHYFDRDCAFNPLAVTITMLFTFLNTGISISKIAPHGALLTSALVSTYCTWLAYSAMNAIPFTDCNPLASENTPSTVGINIGIATASVAYIAFVSGNRETRTAATRGSAPDQIKVDIPGEGGPQADSYWNYHLVMLLLSFYLAMLLSNWAQRQDSDDQRHDAGLASAWVQLGTSWLCSLLYLWTLIAPALCPNRDFGV